MKNCGRVSFSFTPLRFCVNRQACRSSSTEDINIQTANPSRIDVPVTFEEILYALISKCGPVITIGRPGEKTPPLGASRFWVDDDKWKRFIDDLLQQAQYVIMIMGDLNRAGHCWLVPVVILTQWAFLPEHRQHNVDGVFHPAYRR